MITHVVMWKFKETAEGNEKSQNLLKAKELLEELTGFIPEIREMRVGLDTLHSPQSYDLVLVARFDSMEALERYRDHPEHQRVVRFLRSVHGGRVVIDFAEDP
jgi:hypothetical protein